MDLPLKMIRVLTFLVAISLSATPAMAQARPARAGMIDGVVTTQSGTIRLGGAQIVVRDAVDRQVATVLSEGDGHFSVVALPEGRYRVAASLAGFETATVTAPVVVGETTAVAMDLPIAAISQTVDVVGSAAIVSREGTLALSDAIGSKELEQYAPGGGFQAALRLLASIIEVPGGVSIKGGRPSQAGVQLGAATLAAAEPRAPGLAASRRDSSSSRPGARARSGKRASTISIRRSVSAAADSRSTSRASAHSARGSRPADRS